MGEADSAFEPYWTLVDGPTRHIAECDTGLRLEAVGRLLVSISSVIGTSSEWSHAGEHYVLWAEIHDLTDVFDDAVAFDQVARDAATTWLEAAGDEAMCVQWLADRHDWMRKYAQTHERLF